MTTLDDLTTVIRLACTIEDRADSEQRALLNIARGVDQELNKNIVTNRRMWGESAGALDAVRLLPPSQLEWEVHETRVRVDNQKEVRLPAKRGAAAIKDRASRPAW